ncbi:radial spoke head 10 B-like isoform X3 [Histomonas meleagridis]|uniref:radial spoke head 10-like B-like isoform X3 n=1 Tax=Histomonas meleagridis TaxID=135588 RepID=UPI003559E059|nr:radial spoke head 10 B-like isoform X3 [Histomonas meleagridis]KAH0805965.1 radial spoke head 10-like B-like isoform X3 [Histomonas meleagridis]
MEEENKTPEDENINEAPPNEAEEETEENQENDDKPENPFGFNFSSSVTQCFAKAPVVDGKIIFFSGNEYEGEMQNGIIHGNGTYKWADLGITYTGTFNWGDFTGKGKITFNDGSSYEGEIVNGVRNGTGTYRKNGEHPFVYTGEWLNGKFHGKGICYFGEEGCHHRYEGEFVSGEREGHGIMYYPNGNIYDGEWHHGKRHGEGKFTWSNNGSYYIGHFEEGEICGEGELVYAFSSQSPSVQFVQSNRYLGTFSHSLRNGFGSFYYANGAVYKGEWKDNKKNGKGIFTSRDGRVYNNEFRDGSIYENGKLYAPTPSISLNFSLDGLLTSSESYDEVMSSLCNVYIRFLPKLRSFV